MPGPVFLEGDSTTLHPIEPDDAPFLAEVVNDPAVRAGTAGVRPFSEAQERGWIESIDEHNPDGVNLLICADGDPVGTIGLTDVVQHWRVAQVGYMLDPDAWDQGYGTDAVETIVAYGVRELGLERITARVFETNPASARVLEKAGFTEEGRFREHAVVDGERVDLRLFGILAAEV